MINDQFDKSIRCQSREELVTVLRCAGGEHLNERHILCPFHADSVKSAEIRQSATTSRWYFYCHRCGIADDVWALQARVEGRSVEDILREARQICRTDISIKPLQAPKKLEELPQAGVSGETSSCEAPASTGWGFATVDDLISYFQKKMPEMVVEEVNPYTDPATGQPDLYTIRYRPTPADKKAFIQATPSANGWQPKGFPGDKKVPLFNRIRLDKAERVLLVEGEKSVRAVTELGIPNLVAVSSCGGSKAARRCDWSPLAGKTVYVWADNDEVGHNYAEEVISYLKELSPPVKLFRIRVSELDLPDHGDVVEYIADNRDDPVAAIELVLLDAEGIGAARSLAQHFAKIAAGEYSLVEFQRKPHLTSATQALLPGTVTIVAGEPEAAKSFFVLEEAWRQFESGVTVRCLMLEDDHAFHLRRALAQMSGEADILDHKYTETHIEWAQQLFSRYQTRLDAFGTVLEADGSRERTIFEVADWVEKSAELGTRLIIVDPITAASTGDMSWKDDRKFMMRAKFAAEKYGCSILLVTHPKLGKPGAPGLSGLAGGAAYSRFSQTVIWLKKYPELQTGSISDGYFTKEGEYLRTVQVQKARNGRDGDKQTSRMIAVRLNPENLCFTELGMLI